MNCRSPAGRPNACHRHGQHGVALITALLVVALATVAAVTVAARQELDVRRTSNLLEADQAYAYGLGAEIWAQVILERDANESKTDHLAEDWATVIPPIFVEGGRLWGHIEDLQGRFNLNNLLRQGAPSEPHVQQFKRLLSVLGLKQELAVALLDWMDEDTEVRFPDGAEDDEYLSGDTPYRAANRPLVSISELRLVKGFDAEAVNKLAPHVAALPEATTINVNTATTVVLQSLAEGMSQEEAEKLAEDRGEEGYASLAAFLQHGSLAGRTVNQALLSLESSYFLIDGEVEIGNTHIRMFSIIHRDKTAGTKVVMRTLGSQ